MLNGNRYLHFIFGIHFQSNQFFYSQLVFFFVFESFLVLNLSITMNSSSFILTWDNDEDT